jgi:hypothetical protein
MAGIVTAALGLVVALLSIAGLLPGLTKAGVALILLGGLIIGLSFVERPEAGDTERMSTPATLINMFFSPTEVFRNFMNHPRWLAAAIIISLLSTIFTGLFLYRLTPEVVVNHTIDKTLQMPMMNDEARTQIEAGRQAAIDENKNVLPRIGQAVSSFAWAVFIYAFLAIVFVLFAVMMGGRMNYWQAFSVAVYAYLPVSVLQFIIRTTTLFMKDPTEIHPLRGPFELIQDNLSFLVSPADSPVLFTILGAFGLLWFYWAWLNATGLKTAGDKVSSSAAWSATLTIYAAWVLLLVVLAILFPNFMS